MADEVEAAVASAKAPIARKPLAWREIATFSMAYTVVVGFLALIVFLVVKKAISESNLMLLLGNISGGFGASYGFYTGSSQGSTAKGGTLEKLAEK